MREFDQAKSNKARGFYGMRCWGCYCIDEAKRKLLVPKTVKKIAQQKHYQKIATPEYLAFHNERAKEWARQNPGKANAKTARRRASVCRQTPSWADHAKIQDVYLQAAQQNLSVDHIVPLHGKLVSGLHVHNNLQLLPGNANSAKGNTWA